MAGLSASPLPPLTLRDGGPLTLRVAAEEDALATLLLERAVLAEGEWFIRDPDELPSVGARTAEIRDLSAQPNGLYLLAFRGASLLGFLTIHGGHLRRMRHTGKLALMVEARHRGLGIGEAMLTAALVWAEATPQLEKLGLAVYGGNERALALYRKHGFMEEGRREREYKLPSGEYRGDVLMWRAVG